MGSAGVNGPLWGERVVDWAERQEPTTRALVDAVHLELRPRPGVAHLDLACGAGLALQLAAAHGADVAGVDASPAMAAYAAARTPGARVEVADLEALPFPDASFDAVTSFNGVQYAADVDAAVREAARVLKPGGRLAVAVWGPPEALPAAAVIGALRPLLPPPPPGAPGPFAMSDPAVLEALAARAGLETDDVLTLQAPLRYRGLDEAVRGFDSSGVAARARAAAGEAAVTDAHRRALTPFVGAEGEIEIGAAYLVLLAVRPR